MKIEIHLDGSFSDEQHEKLAEITNKIIIDWKIDAVPLTGDYFNLDAFYDKMPKFTDGGCWQVTDREFFNEDTIILGLMFIY